MTNTHYILASASAILFSLGNFRLGNYALEACVEGGGLVPLIIAWSLRYSRQSELGNKADRKYIIYM